jgi:hypothetical protein
VTNNMNNEPDPSTPPEYQEPAHPEQPDVITPESPTTTYQEPAHPEGPDVIEQPYHPATTAEVGVQPPDSRPMEELPHTGGEAGLAGAGLVLAGLGAAAVRTAKRMQSKRK